MKKIIFYIIATAFTFTYCTSKDRKTEEPVIESTCRELMSDTLTPEEAARWDSMHTDDSRFLLIRGAKRDLDTIINHYHVVFSTQP